MDPKVIIGGAIALILLLLMIGSSESSRKSKGVIWKCDGAECYPVYQNNGYWSPATYYRNGLTNTEAYYVGQARPAVDLPYELRKRNWGGGSCVHATTITLLRHLADGSGDPNLHELAETWPYSGGEFSSRHKSRIEAANLCYVMTVDGDAELLRWAVATRRGCGIAYRGHCVTLAGYDEQTGEALILDNNRTSVYKRQPWDELIRDWQPTGWAFAFVYDPPVPVPNASLSYFRN